MKSKGFMVSVRTLLTLLLFLLLSRVAHAATTTLLTTIGVMDLGGKTYSEWWYTGINPTLAGTAGSGSKVTITIDDKGNEVTAGSSGAWSYTPTTLTAGDHKISITSGSDTYAFTLHAGQALPESSTSAATSTASPEVPTTGSNMLFGLLFGTASIGMALYFFLTGSRKLALNRFERDATE